MTQLFLGFITLLLGLIVYLLYKNRVVVQIIPEEFKRAGKGYVFIPDGKEDFRENIIKKNEEQGKDTPFLDLI